MRLLDGFSRAGAVRLTGVLLAAVAVCCAGASSATAAAVIVDNITFPSGSELLGVSSDGTHVWTMSYNGETTSNTVFEIDAASGAIVNTIPDGSGNDAGAVSSDGTHVWVVNGIDGTVSELDAATGAIVRTITVGTYPNYPDAVSSDGVHVWVDLIGGTVVEIDEATGAIVRTITVDLNSGSEGISSDGADVWVANYNDDTVSEIDAATGVVINTIDVGEQPSAVSSDGTHVWVTNAGDGTVSEIDAATGEVVNTITVGSNPHGVSADGTDVWVTNLNSGQVSEIDAATGAIVNTIPVGTGGSAGPFQVSSDGSHVWVANGGTGVDYEGTVTEILIGPSAPDIVAGPENPTRSTSATFEFTSDTTGAQFECSLDASAFSACSSPQTYSDLGDGKHTFQVREHDPGEDPGPQSEYDWAVYTHPPTLSVDSAPSGTTTSQTATVSFHGAAEDGNDAEISYTCSLDGAPASVCSSPDTLNDLSPGPHTLTIFAVDDVGNDSAPVTVGWTLSTSTTPPPTACVAPLKSAAASGLLFMEGRDGTCLKRSGNTPYGPIFSATGPVTLDGVTVIPTAGSTLTLTPSKTASVFSSTGGVQVQLGSLSPFPIKGPIKWTASVGTGLLSTGSAPWTPSIGGLHAVVDPSALDLSPDNGGSVKMTITVQLPGAFSALPGAATGVSADFTITASNTNGVDFSGQLNVASVYIGTTQVKDLRLGYDVASGTFMGSATILLVPQKGPNITTSITIGPPSSESVIGCCVRQFALAVQDINKEIPDTPLFLQTIGGSASSKTTPGGVSYPAFAGNVALTLGPQTGQTPPAVSFDGGLELDLSPQWTLTATGVATIDSFPLAHAKVMYTEGGTIQLEGGVDVTIRGYGFSAAIGPGTFFQVGGNYNIDATGTVTLGPLGSATGEVVFSNNGFAACATIDGFAVGWGVLANGMQEPFASTCNMGPYEATASSVRARAAGAALRFSLGAHNGQRLIAVHGADAAPQVALTGPDGISLTGGAEASETRDGLIVPDPTSDTTYVILGRSPAGSYSVTSTNTAITSVSIASSLPPVSVSVHTRSLRDGKRQLSYSQRTAPGQYLELLEQGSRGNDRLLLRTTRAQGQLIYTPRVGLGPTRTIRAITVANSLPRATETLAPYRVNDSPPARVRSLSRHGQRLSWAKTPRAVSYMLAFTTTSGATPTATTRARTARIPANATAAMIVALDAADRPGPATTIKLPAPIAHPHKPK